MPTAKERLLSLLSSEGAALTITYEKSNSASRIRNTVYLFNGKSMGCYSLIQRCLDDGLLRREGAKVTITEKGRSAVPAQTAPTMPAHIKLSPLQRRKYEVRLNELIDEAAQRGYELTSTFLEELSQIALKQLNCPLVFYKNVRGGVVMAQEQKPPYAQEPSKSKLHKLPSGLRKQGKVKHRY